MLKIVLFSCLVVLAIAKERSQCEVQHNVLEEDWNNLKANPSKPSEKMLCLFKCWYERNGNVNQEGVLDVEKMIENVGKRQPLTDQDKASIRECAKGLGPVKSCADVAPSYNCVGKVFENKKH